MIEPIGEVLQILVPWPYSRQGNQYFFPKTQAFVSYKVPRVAQYAIPTLQPSLVKLSSQNA